MSDSFCRIFLRRCGFKTLPLAVAADFMLVVVFQGLFSTGLTGASVSQTRVSNVCFSTRQDFDGFGFIQARVWLLLADCRPLRQAVSNGWKALGSSRPNVKLLAGC